MSKIFFFSSAFDILLKKEMYLCLCYTLGKQNTKQLLLINILLCQIVKLVIYLAEVMKCVCWWWELRNSCRKPEVQALFEESSGLGWC